MIHWPWLVVALLVGSMLGNASRVAHVFDGAGERVANSMMGAATMLLAMRLLVRLGSSWEEAFDAAGYAAMFACGLAAAILVVRAELRRRRREREIQRRLDAAVAAEQEAAERAGRPWPRLVRVEARYHEATPYCDREAALRGRRTPRPHTAVDERLGDDE